MKIIRYSYPAMLASSKNTSYRTQATHMTQVLMRFLVDNALLTESPYHADGSLDEQFEVTKANLTEDGNQLFKLYFPKWSNRIDRGDSPDDIKALVNGLAKIRAAAQE